MSNENLTYLAPDLRICSLINGMWQISGGHGYIDKDQAIKSMNKYVDNGFVTWDLADHYGPAEDFVKIFRKMRIKEKNEDSLKNVKFFTKWVPKPQIITKPIVKQAINISRKRMGMQTIDMLQFHWWDYQDKNYIKAVEYLDELREEGILGFLGLTNFDTEHVEEFLKLGINIISNQVQYSIIDRRPEQKMISLCRKYKIKLLTYGTLCGGLLSERYLDKPEPFKEQLYTPSLLKYKNVIDLWGNWALFQELLHVLKKIALKYDVSIANVAVRYVLQNSVVGGVIIGVRLGISEHIEQNSRVFNFSLNHNDINLIENILSRSNDLMQNIGDCGDEYR